MLSHWGIKKDSREEQELYKILYNTRLLLLVKATESAQSVEDLSTFSLESAPLENDIIGKNLRHRLKEVLDIKDKNLFIKELLKESNDSPSLFSLIEYHDTDLNPLKSKDAKVRLKGILKNLSPKKKGRPSSNLILKNFIFEIESYYSKFLNKDPKARKKGVFTHSDFLEFFQYVYKLAGFQGRSREAIRKQVERILKEGC